MSGSETAGSARDGERLFTPQGTVQPELDEPGSNEHQGSMVSVDFSMPLKGQARVERIRQMTNSHDALKSSSRIQEILCKVQKALRRMPGVSSAEAEEVNAQLQEAGQATSQEISQLVDALMNVTLDGQDVEREIARLTLRYTLAKADAEEKTRRMADLTDELEAERQKLAQAKAHGREIMGELQTMTDDYRSLRETASGSKSVTPPARDELIKIKALEDKITHLEDQVNNRRSLWIMKNGDAKSVTKALETLADSIADRAALHESLTKVCASVGGTGFANGNAVSSSSAAVTPSLGDGLGRLANTTEFSNQLRLTSAYQPQPPIERPSTSSGGQAAQQQQSQHHHQHHQWSPLQAGPPRAPSVAPHGRLLHSNGASSGLGAAVQGSSSYTTTATSTLPGAWSATVNGVTSSSSSSGRALALATSLVPSSAYARTPTRRPSHIQSRYRPNAPEFHPLALAQDGGMPSRPMTSMGHIRDHRFHGSPQPIGRGRFSRPHEGGQDISSALVSRNMQQHQLSSIVHVTSQSMAAWAQQVGNFYAVTRSFVERHASDTISATVAGISRTPIWEVLTRIYLPLSEAEAASYLEFHLKDRNSKMCLVTRVVIDYVVSLVWVPGAWKGFDPETTEALVDVEREMARTQGQPGTARQPLLDRQAAVLDAIMKQCEANDDFYKMRTDEIAATILGSLQPLLNRGCNPIDAYADMEAVAEHAWDLSSKILTSRLTFDFRFPEIGSRFSMQSMIPIWPDNIDAVELQSRHWRVALVTTPVITCRNDTGTNISAHSVSHADVICMQ